MLLLSLFLVCVPSCGMPPLIRDVTPTLPTLSPQPTTSTSPVPTAKQAAQVEPTATVPVASIEQPTATPEPLRLTLWANENTAGLELLRTLAAEYATAHDIVIDLVQKSPSALRVDMIASELVQEPPPDLIWGDQDDLAGLLADGQLQPVELALDSEQFIPAVIVSATRDEQFWGLPVVAQDYLLVFYNRAFIQQPPATSDELIVLSRGVAIPGVAGIVAGWDQALWLLAWLNGYGGAPTTPDGMQPTLDTPQMYAALNLVRELRMAAPPEQMSYVDADQLFQTGQAALAIDGDWSLPFYRDPALGMDIGVAPMPRVPSTDRLAAPPLGATYVMRPALLSPDKQAPASAFSDFLTQPETQLRVALALKRLPVVRSELQNPQIIADPDMAAGVFQADAASGLPPTKALSCALTAINLHLPFLLNNQTDQEQTARSMQQSATECLAR